MEIFWQELNFGDSVSKFMLDSLLAYFASFSLSSLRLKVLFNRKELKCFCKGRQEVEEYGQRTEKFSA